MIVEREFDGSKEDVFKVITKAIIEDVKICTDKDLKEKDIKVGFSYSKYLGGKKGSKAKATIKKYTKPTDYELKVKSDNGTTTISYKLLNQDNATKLIYEETFKTKDGKEVNSFFHNRSIKKRMNKYFDDIEAFITDKD
ncbi:MAG: DUF3284 domain-containing protein [Thomasclavelia sp.]|nr:DUF3284 domain-containing protein [Thomasclavelia sp.]